MSDNVYYHHERPELVAEVPEGAARVLDVGCGAGAMSNAIRRDRGAQELWGMEIVPEMAAKAADNPALDKVLAGNVENGWRNCPMRISTAALPVMCWSTWSTPGPPARCIEARWAVDLQHPQHP